eukprot:4427779-Ditylum_brightwellii.AAC.1
MDEESSSFLLIKHYKVWAVGSNGMVSPLCHDVYESASRVKSDGWCLFSLVLPPIRYQLVTFILKDTPVEVSAHFIVLFGVLGAVEHVASAGDMRNGLIVLAA